MRLRTILTLVMIGIGAPAVGVALALVLLTSSLYESGVRLANATERARLVMELESIALQDGRNVATSDTQRAIEIIDRLRATSDPGSSAGEVDRLDDMIISFSNASTPSEPEARFDALVTHLRHVVAHEDQRAARAMTDAASWNTVADVIGIAAIVVLLVGVAAVLGWLWRSALQPLVKLVGTIGRFAKGDTTARVAETGPSEIREVAAAFNDMTLSLAQQREQQLAFIGGVAHDLRSPLNALQVAAALLDHPAPDCRLVRDRIQRQIARMDHMIGDLLDRTRIEAGQFELQCHSCDLRDLLTRVVDMQHDSASTRVFRLRLTREAVAVRCDSMRIEQVMTNLLSNAVKYSPETSDVEIVLERDRSFAVLSVMDHGIGMMEADRERVFEPFRRGKNVGNIAGTGLGLSVTRKIVEAHGGAVGVSSELGIGSVFSVTLPLVSDVELDCQPFGREHGSPASMSAL